MKKGLFSLTATSQFESSRPISPESFTEHRNQLPSWKKNLLQHVFTDYPDSFATIIQQQSSLIIAIDRIKSRNKSGGGWIVTSAKGTLLVHGTNPDLESKFNMHFHRSEVYAMLSVLIFLTQNVAEQKVHSVLISTSTYLIINFSPKLLLAQKLYIRIVPNYPIIYDELPPQLQISRCNLSFTQK